MKFKDRRPLLRSSECVQLAIVRANVDCAVRHDGTGGDLASSLEFPQSPASMGIQAKDHALFCGDQQGFPSHSRGGGNFSTQIFSPFYCTCSCIQRVYQALISSCKDSAVGHRRGLGYVAFHPRSPNAASLNWRRGQKALYVQISLPKQYWPVPGASPGMEIDRPYSANIGPEVDDAPLNGGTPSDVPTPARVIH